MLPDPLIHHIVATEPGFPIALSAIRQPVTQLWYRGRLPDGNRPSLAIVGGRAASLAGCAAASQIAAAAVEAGYEVVSGGALGIDAAAHQGALDAGGPTYAVLGCGVDVVYPDRHVDLFASIVQQGGLLAEYPPGTEPRRGQFPVRNRIVAALAEVVVVVEAHVKSGALITARLAGTMGRRVLAVPGSAGAEGLLASGAAGVVTGGGDLRRALSGAPPPARPVPLHLTPVLTALALGGAAPAEIARRLGLSLPATLALIAEAELDGWVRRRPGGTYEVRHASA